MARGSDQPSTSVEVVGLRERPVAGAPGWASRAHKRTHSAAAGGQGSEVV